jgi:hypothetical protein
MAAVAGVVADVAVTNAAGAGIAVTGSRLGFLSDAATQNYLYMVAGSVAAAVAVEFAGSMITSPIIGTVVSIAGAVAPAAFVYYMTGELWAVAVTLGLSMVSERIMDRVQMWWKSRDDSK